jgi:hypothetical protein
LYRLQYQILPFLLHYLIHNIYHFSYNNQPTFEGV